MTYYQALLEGKGFLIEHEGEIKPHGFFTTRWVKAINPEAAELAAVELLKIDANLVNLTRNNHESDPTPMIYLEELNTVSWFTYFRRKPGSGYSFYLEDNEQS
jgi:hypothetical protein